MFRVVTKFDYSLRKQQIAPKKIYVCDTGFLNNVGFRFSENRGLVYENAVFLELARRGKEVYYWKGKQEVDFIVKKGLKVKEAIQVCFDVKNAETREREIGGLLEAMEKFKLKEGIVITEDYAGEQKVKRKKIRFVPLWAWLLSS